MANVDGIVPLDEVDTLLSTWASFFMNEELPPDKTQDGGDEVLQATLARTVRTRPKDPSAGKCRVSGVPDPSGSGVGKGSGKTQVRNRARKAVTQV